MQDHRRRRITSLTFLLFLLIGLFSVAKAQGPGMPSPPSPGPSIPRPTPSRPSVPRPTPGRTNPTPGNNRPSSGYNRTTPGRSQPSPSPYSPGRSSSPNTNYPTGNPSNPYAPTPTNPTTRYSQSTSRPFTTIAPPRPEVPVPGGAYAPRIHGAPIQPMPGSQWDQAQREARSGQYESAQTIIDQQIKSDGSLNSLMSAVSVMEQSGAPGSVVADYRNQAYDMARENARQGGSDPMPWIAIAKFSLEDQDDAVFNQASDTLNQRFPDHEYSHYFNGMKAIKNEDWKTAEIELKKAEELGLPNDAVAEWLKLVIDRQKIIWDFAYYTVYLILGWIASMFLLYCAGRILSSLTLRSLRQGYSDRISLSQRLLRRAYRLVVGAAGLYYYLSLPMLLLLSIALPLSIGYALLMVPVLNMYLIVIVLVAGVGGFITALSGIRACFIRPKPIDPDANRLSQEEHPELWAFVRDVAEKVGTRTVDEIVFVPSAEIGVCELGGYLKKLRNRGKRVLILGAAAIEGLSARSLRSILAHEYGHFLNRDTAGGRMTLQVNMAVDNFVVALMLRRKIHWWDLGIHFLRLYYALYARLTFGASRLQELHSDFTAVSAYGPAAFCEGLTHVVRRSVEFDNELDRIFEETVKIGAAPDSIFGEVIDLSPGDFEANESMVITLLNQPSGELDSHPSPSERFAVTSKSGLSNREGDCNSDAQAAWDLIPKRDDLLKTINDRIRTLLEERAKQLLRENKSLLKEMDAILKQHRNADVLRFERAVVAFNLKQYADALADLAILLGDRYDPSFPPDLLLLQAEIHHELGDYRQAVDSLEALVDKYTCRDASIFCFIGACYMRLEEYGEAAIAYGRALKINRKLAPALLGRGRAYAKLAKADEFERDFANFERHYPIKVGPYGSRPASPEEVTESS